jgi:hypothetical protein
MSRINKIQGIGKFESTIGQSLGELGNDTTPNTKYKHTFSLKFAKLRVKSHYVLPLSQIT